MRGSTAPTSIYLEQFFDNLLFGATHELRNRYLHIAWGELSTQETTQETTQEISISGPPSRVKTSQRILDLLANNPLLTARELADILGISFDGVRYHLTKLRRSGQLRHEGPTKGGHWVVLAKDGDAHGAAISG